jgi:hypothetical protein
MTGTFRDVGVLGNLGNQQTLSMNIALSYSGNTSLLRLASALKELRLINIR